MTSRCSHDNGKPRTYNNEPGKTRDNILTPEYLYTVMKFCDDNEMIGLRNHAVDRKGLPDHEHFQLKLQETPFAYFTRQILNIMSSPGIGENISTILHTHFDNLVFDNSNIENRAEQAAQVLERMEKDNQVFNLFYDLGSLVVSPRQSTNTYLLISGGAPVHWFPHDKDIANKVRKHMPLKGEYGWDKYVG